MYKLFYFYQIYFSEFNFYLKKQKKNLRLIKCLRKNCFCFFLKAECKDTITLQSLPNFLRIYFQKYVKEITNFFIIHPIQKASANISKYLILNKLICILTVIIF